MHILSRSPGSLARVEEGHTHMPVTPDQALRKLLWALENADPCDVRDAIYEMWGFNPKTWDLHPTIAVEAFASIDLNTRMPSRHALHAACRDILDAQARRTPTQSELRL